MTTINVLQGTDSGIRWQCTDVAGEPYDLTGWTVKAQARSTPKSATVLHEWSAALGNAFIFEGNVTLTWSHAQTSAWPWTSGVYDIELTSPEGNVSRLDSGTIYVKAEVTR